MLLVSREASNSSCSLSVEVGTKDTQLGNAAGRATVHVRVRPLTLDHGDRQGVKKQPGDGGHNLCPGGDCVGDLGACARECTSLPGYWVVVWLPRT